MSKKRCLARETSLHHEVKEPSMERMDLSFSRESKSCTCQPYSQAISKVVEVVFYNRLSWFVTKLPDLGFLSGSSDKNTMQTHHV